MSGRGPWVKKKVAKVALGGLWRKNGIFTNKRREWPVGSRLYSCLRKEEGPKPKILATWEKTKTDNPSRGRNTESRLRAKKKGGDPRHSSSHHE